MAENPSEEGMQVDEDDFILSLSPGEGAGNGVSEVIATEVSELPADLVNTDVSELVEADNSSLWLTLEGSLSGTQDLETGDTVDALTTVVQSNIANSVIEHGAFAEDTLIQSEEANPIEVETMEVEMPQAEEVVEDNSLQGSASVSEGPFTDVSQSMDNIDISVNEEPLQTPTAEVQPMISFTNPQVSTVVLSQASQFQTSQSQVFYSVPSSGVGGGAASSVRVVNAISSGAKPIASVVSASGIVGQQPIRLLSPAKTITLQQAQQLGLFSPRKTPTIAISKVAISGTGTFATVTAGSTALAAARQPGKLAIPAGNLTVMKNPILRTPTKIAPAPVQPATSGQQPTSLFIKNSAGQVTMATLVTKTGSPTVASSPQKIVLRPATPSSVTSSPAKVTGQPAQYIRLTTAQAVAAGILPGVSGTPTGTGQLQIGNSRIQLVRLVTPGASSGSSSVTTSLSPAVATTATSSIKVVPKTTGGTASKVTTPVKSAAGPASSAHGAQRLLLPAGSLAGSNLVVVPAQYVTQQQQVASSTSGVQPLISSSDGASNAAAAAAAELKLQPSSVKSTQPKITLERSPSDSSTSQSQGSKTPASLDANGIKPRKPCNCTKSQCLKLYCDCFANGEFCNGCNCVSCANNLEHEELRSRAVRACLDRNPQAFKPKIGVSWGPEPRRHNKGCHCKRSGCLKNYCECYEAKIACTAICKCVGCKNCFDGEPMAVTPEKKAIKSGAPAFQYTAPEPVLPITIKTEERVPVDVPSRGPGPLSLSGTRPAFSFITQEVVEATCQCLLAQAEEAEKAGKDTVAAEGMVLQEFGRCLLQIIEYAAKAKSTGLNTAQEKKQQPVNPFASLVAVSP